MHFKLLFITLLISLSCFAQLTGTGNGPDHGDDGEKHERECSEEYNELIQVFIKQVSPSSKELNSEWYNEKQSALFIAYMEKLWKAEVVKYNSILKELDSLKLQCDSLNNLSKKEKHEFIKLLLFHLKNLQKMNCDKLSSQQLTRYIYSLEMVLLNDKK